jgi:hypothetical protein
MRASLVLLALTACRAAPPIPAADRSDGAIPTLRAPHADEGAVTVDGVINEPAWQRAGRTLGFVHPGTGTAVASSKVNAEAWLLWTDAALYVAARVWDPSPVSAFDPAAEDPHVWERASGVELMLQPGDPGDNADYFEVQVGYDGALWATRFDDYNRPVVRSRDGAMRFGHQEWSPAVRRAQRRGAGHWTVEFAVPWRDVPSARASTPPRPGDVWRANLYSFRDGQRDSLAWSPILGEGNFHRASRWGRVTFIQ